MFQNFILLATKNTNTVTLCKNSYSKELNDMQNLPKSCPEMILLLLSDFPMRFQFPQFLTRYTLKFQFNIFFFQFSKFEDLEYNKRGMNLPSTD